jgi:hypothetical protein
MSRLDPVTGDQSGEDLLGFAFHLIDAFKNRSV